MDHGQHIGLDGDMKTLLIGTGMVARTHVNAIAASEAVSLVGVTAQSQTKTTTFAEWCATETEERPSPFPDIVTAVEANRPDFAIVATPPNARNHLVRALAMAKIPILMEKPVERSLAAASEIVEICASEDLPLGIIFQHRTRAAVQILRERFEELGTLAAVELRVPWWRPQFGYFDQPGRGTYKKDGGGVLITQAIHSLDLMLSLTGPVERVQALARTTSLHDIEVEDFVSAGLEFESGAVGSVLATTAAYPGGVETLEFHGSKGSARLEGDHLTFAFHDGRHEEMGTVTQTGGGADPMGFTHAWHKAVIEDFARSLQESHPPMVTGEEALKVHVLIDALIRSSNEKRIIDV